MVDSDTKKPVAPASAQEPDTPAHLEDSRVFDAVRRDVAFDTEVHEELAGQESVVDIRDFNLWYGDKQALYGVNMIVPKSKVTALIGPSGCGKSTLLRSVNRMNDLIGSVRIEGEMTLAISHGDRDVTLADIQPRDSFGARTLNQAGTFATIARAKAATKLLRLPSR